MKVQFLRDHYGAFTFGTEYLEGDVITLGDANARRLVEMGVCVEVAEDPAPVEPPKNKADWKVPGKK